MLVEEAERTLLGLVALACQVLERLATRHHLTAAYNAAVLVLDEVRLLETTGRVLRCSVKNLRLGTNCDHFGHLIQWNAVLFLRPQ